MAVMCTLNNAIAYQLNYRCPSVAGPPECVLVENREASFPECCPRLKCPEFDNEINDDQIMMASYDDSNPAVYDATLDDYQDVIFYHENLAYLMAAIFNYRTQLINQFSLRSQMYSPFGETLAESPALVLQKRTSPISTVLDEKIFMM